MSNLENIPTTTEPRRRPSLSMFIIAALFVLVPFMFWYGTWFGRDLSNKEIEQYLNETKNSRKVQHALTQAAQHIEKGDPQIKPLYPKIIALADDPTPQVRMTTAWAMGQDNTSQPFHDALLRLLSDQQPLVRRNAALSLSRFNDPACRSELVQMLQPFSVRTDRAGTVSISLQEEESVGIGTLIARIKEGNGQVSEVRSPLGGYLKGVIARDGAEIKVGDELVRISPELKQVWEALRALYIVGGREDLPAIEYYTRSVQGMNSQIQKQAELTAEAIQKRTEH